MSRTHFRQDVMSYPFHGLRAIAPRALALVVPLVMTLIASAALATPEVTPDVTPKSVPSNPGSAAPGSTALTPLTTADFAFEDVDIPERLVMTPAPGSGRITRIAAIQMALAGNAALKAARERVQMARADYRRRSAANNPTLSVGATLVPHPREGEPTESQFPDTDETYLSHTFPTSGSRYHATRSARARLDEARATYRTAELDLLLQVNQAYIDLQVAQEIVRIYEDTFRIAVTLTGLTRRQVQVGAVPETNVLRAQLEEGRAEQDIRRAHADRLVREAQLALLLGLPPGDRIAASERLSPIVPSESLDSLQARALANRPELASTRAELASVKAEVDVARAQRRPDLTVQAQFTDELTNTGNPPYKASIQLPLWDRGRIGGEVDRARAEARMIDWNLEQQRRQVGLEVVRAYRQLGGAAGVLIVFRERVLPNTRTILDRSRIAYLAGSGTLLDILDAQRVFRQAALDVLNATADLARAMAALDRAVGTVAEETTSRSVTETVTPHIGRDRRRSPEGE